MEPEDFSKCLSVLKVKLNAETQRGDFMNLKETIIENKKYIILLALLAIVILLLNFFTNRNARIRDYKNLNLNQKNLNSEKIKNKIMTDEQFIKLLTIDEYNGNIEKNLVMLIESMLIRIDLSKFEIKDNNEKKELKFGIADYKMNINEFYSVFNDYYDYDLKKLNLSKNEELNNFMLVIQNEVIFTLEHLGVNDNLVYLGVENLNINSNIISGNIYVYEVYTNDSATEKELKKELEENLKNDNFEDRALIEKYNLTVTKKKIEFKENSKGKHIKYQLLSLIESN